MVKKTGTREWAESNVNIQRGCEHDCRYCYARHDAVKRFKRCTAAEWAEPVVDLAKVNKAYRKRPGTIMFPTTHDITPKNLRYYKTALGNLLAAGNKVLVVSKPHWNCIKDICDTYHYLHCKKQLMFRFTIGSFNDEELKFWEPGAPQYAERIGCLAYAHRCGFQTSVSCEPYLDPYVHELYLSVKPYLTDSFWIGRLRHFNARVCLDGISEEQLWKFVYSLKAIQTDEAFGEIYQQLKGREFVKWKDQTDIILHEVFS